ncbi:hypothetical protein F3Y22_tig00111841pilonHSYRG00337 [Hibiscus syriacus]|uniref:Uncharacterized protein n=1 Tax=Hibiscus syriacus TaxID=106335 RepID=A0A6A2XB53_HIBSY|nr:hypothetical protein F3Y22_tig00111841pilonHSYRG00337 [Hibiscus syriacus]
MVLTGLFLYARSMISMLFLGRLGELALAGGSLAIGFANITGYSVLSGLSIGMEPICGQAFGAKKYKILGLAMQKMTLLLLLTSIVIASLWLNMKIYFSFFAKMKTSPMKLESTFFILFQTFLHSLFYILYVHI